jgi:20S proteasome alpha/beta subunit
MTIEEGIRLVNYCIHEIQTRFMASQPSFVVKLITKDGIKIITPIEKPIPVQCG